MPLVVAFVSQKGGVGKSTLARGLATFAMRRGLKTRIADLDAQQHTAVVWETTRARHVVKPPVEVLPFGSVKEAVAASKNCEVLILDLAGKITDGATEATEVAHLLVEPTSPSSDDLHISVLVFLAMERVRVEREKLTFALCRVLSDTEEKYARSYLASFGYAVLNGAIPEHLGYREAMRGGRSITETNLKLLDEAADKVMLDLLRTAEKNVGKKTPSRKAGRNK